LGPTELDIDDLVRFVDVDVLGSEPYQDYSEVLLRKNAEDDQSFNIDVLYGKFTGSIKRFKI